MKIKDYKIGITSINNLGLLKKEIKELEDQNKLNQWMIDNYFDYDFKPEDTYKSIVIMALELPVVAFEVEKRGSMHNVIMPSGYYSGGRLEEFNKDIDEYFNLKDIKYKAAHLPAKLLAARTGVSKYGRNNIAYVDDLGSYVKLSVFYTDYEVKEDKWLDIEWMDECKECSICLSSCPTKAIREDDYLINASKCMTFINELEGDFPDWYDTRYHTSFIGCMHCQEKCPMNKPIKDLKVFISIKEESILDFIDNENYDFLKEESKAIVDRFEYSDYYEIFKRNLIAAYNNL